MYNQPLNRKNSLKKLNVIKPLVSKLTKLFYENLALIQ